MSFELLDELAECQQRLVTVVQRTPDEDCYQQFHPDLSPLAWHLGHCAFIDTYWSYEQVLGDNSLTKEDKDLYFPELSPKKERARRLPRKQELIEWSSHRFLENRQILNRLIEDGVDHHLLKSKYLLHFLLQHHSQHFETMQQILQQRALQCSWDAVKLNPVTPVSYSAPSKTFAADRFEFGNHDEHIAYDNERPPWNTHIDSFAIATRAVTNSEYLGFMGADGYQNQEWWSEDGWRWLQQAQVESPNSWRQKSEGAWYAVTATGPVSLDSDATLSGINWYEAQAFAKYAGGRLPHELEWELSATSGACAPGQAWEWCENTFFPYPKYRAYPYDGYSQPWFDGNHYTLRGASLHTPVPVRRTTFRNFYTPEKRHVFAGIRVAFDT